MHQLQKPKRPFQQSPTPEIVKRLSSHESIFSANQDQRTQWETHTIKPKSKGAGIQKNVCQENGSNRFHQRGECTNSSSQNVPSTTDLKCPTPEIVEKTVVLFHCESIFSVNEDQRTQWGTQDMHAIKPKVKVLELWSLILLRKKRLLGFTKAKEEHGSVREDY